MAQNILERIQETNIEKFPSQILKDYYEAAHMLAEAQAAKNGIKTSGEGAHKQLIEWVCTHCNLTMAQCTLFDQLRTFRNKISYEGFNLTPEYLKRNDSRIQELLTTIKNTL